MDRPRYGPRDLHPERPAYAPCPAERHAEKMPRLPGARGSPPSQCHRPRLQNGEAVASTEVASRLSRPPAAAELLVDMVVGNAIPALLDPDRVLRNPEEQAARRDWALDIFLNGVRPRTTFG